MVRQCFSVVRAQNSKRCNAFFKDSASVFFSDSGQILPTGAKYPPEIHTLIFQALIPKIGLRICFFSRTERLFFVLTADRFYRLGLSTPLKFKG